MTARDMFLKAMRRESDGYVPKNIALCPSQCDRFEKEYGHRNYMNEWHFAHRAMDLPFKATAEDFSRWLGETNDRTLVDQWGIGHERATDGSHFERLIHPLGNAKSLKDIEDYPFPSAADEQDVIGLSRRVKAAVEEGYACVVYVCPVGGTIFWPPYKMRGMESLLCDMYEDSDVARFLFDKTTELCTVQARLVASAGADILYLADDLGTQSSTYMSPQMFRRWIKPRLAEVIAAAKQVKPDLLIHFHSDGAIQPFIPDFIEIGVDILNPIQPECMDPIELKKDYGDRLSFSGCVGTQTTLPFGTADEVRAKVRLYCEEVGKGGGLWIAPTHLVEPEVPWENIIAFVEAADEYGS